MHATTSSSPILSATWRKLLLSLHVATTVSILGMALVLLTLGIANLGGADPRTIYPAASLVDTWLVAPLAVLSLGTGLLLGLLIPWGVFRYWWVIIKLAVTSILTFLVLFVLIPRLGMVAAVVTRSDAGSLPISQRVLLVIAPALASLLLLLNVGLAMFKPGRRRRPRATPEGASLLRTPNGAERHEFFDGMRRGTGENCFCSDPRSEARARSALTWFTRS